MLDSHLVISIFFLFYFHKLEPKEEKSKTLVSSLPKAHNLQENFFLPKLSNTLFKINPSKHLTAHVMKIEKSKFKEDKEFAQSYSAGKWGLTTIF